MSLFYLNTSDFVLSQSPDGNVNLCTEINGISLILFYSPSCVHCSKLAFPLIKSMPNILRGCTYATVNIGTNKQLIDISKGTTTPITYVPLIILYYNGLPLFKYDGDANVGMLKQFIIEVSNHIRNQNMSTLMTNNPKIKKHHKSIAIWGEPLYGDDERTYLEFEPAYNSNNSRNNNNNKQAQQQQNMSMNMYHR